MTRFKLALTAFAMIAVAVVVLSCGQQENVAVETVSSPEAPVTEAASPTTTIRTWDQMTTDEWGFVKTWYDAENTPPPTTAPPVVKKAVVVRKPAAAPRQSAPAAEQGNGQCGGDLPPCYVMNRESGGNIRAKNPTSTASGKWQFLNSTWQGYGGYGSAMDAPEEVQDARARALWSGGSGCSHWSACR